MIFQLGQQFEEEERNQNLSSSKDETFTIVINHNIMNIFHFNLQNKLKIKLKTLEKLIEISF